MCGHLLFASQTLIVLKMVCDKCVFVVCVYTVLRRQTRLSHILGQCCPRTQPGLAVYDHISGTTHILTRTPGGGGNGGGDILSANKPGTYGHDQQQQLTELTGIYLFADTSSQPNNDTEDRLPENPSPLSCTDP